MTAANPDQQYRDTTPKTFINVTGSGFATLDRQEDVTYKVRDDFFDGPECQTGSGTDDPKAVVERWGHLMGPGPDVSVHTFNRCVNTILKRAIEISDQRGGEYLDTWALENVHTPFGDHVDSFRPTCPSDEWKRLRTLASLIDVKISRMGGPWKDDTTLDLINYLAAFTQLANEYHGR